MTEAETEAETEGLTESEPETEAESETETEAVTEAESETEGETETETETEGLIEETEVETEAESESEAVMDEEAVEEESLQVMELAAAAKVEQLTVTVTDKDGKPVEGAVWVLKASENIVPAADITIPDQQGKDVTYKQGQTAFIKDQEVFRWTTDGKTAETDLAPYLIPGGSYYWEEETAPENYNEITIRYDLSADEDGTVRNYNGDTVKELSILYTEKTEQVLSLQVAVQDAEAGADNTYAYLAGARLVIKDEAGQVLTDPEGNPYLFTSTDGIMKLNLDPELYGALAEGLENGGSRTFAVAQIQAPEGYRADGYAEAAVVIAKDGSGSVTLTLDDRYAQDLEDGSQALVFKNRKIPEDAAGTISVTVRSYYNGQQIYATNGITHYAALFSDPEKTNRISDVLTVEIEKGYKAATVKFENLINGTYYVGETDQYGNLVGTVKEADQARDAFYAQYLLDGKETDQVIIKTDEDILDADVEAVSIHNQYFAMLEGFVNTASFNITLQLRDSSGAALSSSETFYAGIYTKNAGGTYRYIGRKSIKMGGGSEKTIKAEITMSTETKDVMVKEVDASGNEITNSTVYTTVISPQEITLTAGEQQQQTVTIVKTRLASAETETETETEDPNAGKARLRLTKKVAYKDTAIRVNSVYYIGIFDDPELTKLRYSRAMVLNDASELTASLLVNLDKTETGEVTFYFAEVDEEGNLLESGKDFGYDIELNQDSVTLNSENMEDEIIVTNNVVEGSDVAAALTDPYSGFAGDHAALATAQNLAASANSSDKAQTGDDSPLLPLVGVMGGCAAAIVLLAAVLIRKRRYRG